MKKLGLFLFTILSSFTLMLNVNAAENKEKVNIYMFTKQGCPVCARAETYFAKLSSDKEYGPMFNLVTLKVFDEKWNIVNQEFYDTLIDITQKMGDQFNGVPYIIVGDKNFNGFDEKFDEEIKENLKRCYEKGYKDPIAITNDNKDEDDPDKGMKNAINVITIIIIIGIPAIIIASRISTRKPKENIDNKKPTVAKKTKPKDKKESNSKKKL